jgi:hypothetical protein
MTSPATTPPEQPTLESVLRRSWEAFHPSQPAPLGWLTHTTSQVMTYLRDVTTPPPRRDAAGCADGLTRFRQHVREALADAVSQDDIDIDAATAILEELDLPLLPRRWQVRLALPLLIEVTATSREDAFDTAEAAIETALADLTVSIEWDGHGRDDATAGELDTDSPLPHHNLDDNHGG